MEDHKLVLINLRQIVRWTLQHQMSEDWLIAELDQILTEEREKRNANSRL